ncbi:LacI family DNA-binding transcriptional regulator [Pradoshia sp.]
MLTIKEIAQRANVSRTTVSRVLNNSGYVSEKARSEVLKVIEETGYVPSQHAKSLRTKKTKVIGVILPKISTETSSRLVKGIDEVLSESGYQILLANTNLMPEKEIENLRLLKSRHVDGIILSATNTEPELMKEISQLAIPFVAVGQDMPGFSNVVFDDYQAAKDAVQAFIDKGHKRIAFIGVSESDPAVGGLRKKGYLDAMAESGLPVEDSWVQTGIFDLDSGRTCMKDIMETSPLKPTALLAVTDRLAIGAIQYIKDSGMTIPGDVALAGMGGSELSEFITPTLSTVDFMVEEAGREAAILMLELINNNGNNVIKRNIKHRFLQRDSI